MLIHLSNIINPFFIILFIITFSPFNFNDDKIWFNIDGKLFNKVSFSKGKQHIKSNIWY